MIPIPLIMQGLVSAFASKKVPLYSQTVKEFVTSKTNQAGVSVMGYGAYLLAIDPTNYIGHGYLIGGYLVTTIKDAIIKIKTS